MVLPEALGVQQWDPLLSLLFCTTKDFLHKFLLSLVDNGKFLPISSPMGTVDFYILLIYSFFVRLVLQILGFSLRLFNYMITYRELVNLDKSFIYFDAK